MIVQFKTKVSLPQNSKIPEILIHLIGFWGIRRKFVIKIAIIIRIRQTEDLKSPSQHLIFAEQNNEEAKGSIPGSAGDEFNKIKRTAEVTAKMITTSVALDSEQQFKILKSGVDDKFKNQEKDIHKLEDVVRKQEQHIKDLKADNQEMFTMMRSLLSHNGIAFKVPENKEQTGVENQQNIRVGANKVSAEAKLRTVLVEGMKLKVVKEKLQFAFKSAFTKKDIVMPRKSNAKGKHSLSEIQSDDYEDSSSSSDSVSKNAE